MPFRKGQSGNPAGRPKADLEFRALCRTHTPAAIDALVRALDDPDTCVPAAKVLLEHAHGKPTQQVDVNGDLSFSLNLNLGKG